MRSNGMTALEREFQQMAQTPAAENDAFSPLAPAPSSASKSPETPAAIRKLFAFHKKMTRPRPFADNLDLPPAPSPTPPSLFERQRAGGASISGTSSSSPSSSPLRGSPLSAARQREVLRVSRSKLESLGVRAALPVSMGEASTADSANRSTAMLLLSSLRKSLDRQNSPTKGMPLGSGDSPLGARTPPRSSTRYGGRGGPATYVSPPSSHRSDGAAASGAGHPQTETRVLPSNVLEVGVVGDEEDHISESLDSVTRSALDMLARLRATNTIPLEDPSRGSRLIPSASPSFSYLGAEGSLGMSSARLGCTRVIGSLAQSFIHGIGNNGNNTPDKTPPRPDFDRANSALRKMHSAAESVASSSPGVANIHVSRRGSMHITMNYIPTEAEASGESGDGRN